MELEYVNRFKEQFKNYIEDEKRKFDYKNKNIYIIIWMLFLLLLEILLLSR